MPIGYLIPAVLLAWAISFAVAPRRVPAGRLSLVLGVVNEVPFLALVALAWPTLLALSEGDVTGPVGWLAFGLSLLGLAGLVVVVQRGLQAGPAIDKALDDSLGADWRTGIDPRLTRRLGHRLATTTMLGPFFIRRPDVERLADISYGPAGISNQLDVYRHRSRPSGAPVLIHLHGGAMMGGRKDHDALPMLYQLASHGWVCISANYRLSPAATFPDQLIDVKRVIAWVKAHEGEYGADSATLFIAGGSTGGQLAALAALTAGDLALQPGFKQADTSVTAAVSLYGDYDWLDTPGRVPYLARVMKSTPADNRAAWQLASPLYRIRPEAPPFLIIHGDLDTTLPVENARLFAERLREVSHNPVVYAELPGAHHNFDQFHSLRAQAVAAGVEAFAAWVRMQIDGRKP